MNNRGGYGNRGGDYTSQGNLNANAFAGNNSGQQMFNNSDSPSSPKEGKNRSNQTLTPVTVKQILSATQQQSEDTFSIDTFELSQVTFIGVLLNPARLSTNFSFTVDDGTGQIGVRIWIDADESVTNPHLTEKQARWREHTYVRVIGHLRSFNDQRSVVAFRVVPVEDFNEITYHHLETIYIHLLHKNNNNPPAGQQMGGNFFQGGTSYGNNSTTRSGVGGGRITDLQRAVLAAFKECNPNDDAGFSVGTVAQRLRSMYSESDVRNAIHFLCDEGHLFSTVDEEHYKVAF